MHRLRHPERRWLLVAATVLLVVVAALALTRPDDDVEQPAGTTTASTVATVDPNAVPELLQHRWMSGPRDVIGRTIGVSLVFGTHSYQMSAANSTAFNAVRGIAAPDGPSTIDVVSPGDELGCDATLHGRYAWALSPGTRTLTMSAVDDPCAARVAALEGTYWRSSCFDIETNCLGTMEAGAYSSQYVTPLHSASANWTPEFGRIDYVVPDGWANTTDYPHVFGLAWSSEYALETDAKPYTDHELIVVVAPRVNTAECGASEIAGGDTAASLLDTLEARQGITLGERQPVVVGGLSGFQVDLTTDASAYVQCGTDSVVPLLVSPESAPGEWNYGALEGQSVRLIVLDGDAEQGTGTVAIVVQGTADRWDQFLQESMDIIGSMQFA